MDTGSAILWVGGEVPYQMGPNTKECVLHVNPSAISQLFIFIALMKPLALGRFSLINTIIFSSALNTFFLDTASVVHKERPTLTRSRLAKRLPTLKSSVPRVT